jgi:hypothetical protein
MPTYMVKKQCFGAMVKIFGKVLGGHGFDPLDSHKILHNLNHNGQWEVSMWQPLIGLIISMCR